jgi:hypothetical protein
MLNYTPHGVIIVVAIIIITKGLIDDKKEYLFLLLNILPKVILFRN